MSASTLSFFDDQDTFDTDSTFTEGILGDYEAWENVDSTNYLTALGLMFEQAFGIVAAQGDPDDPANYRAGYSTILDVTRCPTWALPFLSQFNGTGVQPGTEDSVARTAIINEATMNRGTYAAMQTAALANLTGTKTLTIYERTDADQNPDAYHAVFLFKQSECPDELALITAVELQKPAGIQITYVDTSGYIWLQAENNWSADNMTWGQTLNLQP